MLDHQLLNRPILPLSHTADFALRRVIAQHLKRHGRIGVSYEEVADGLLIRLGEVEHRLELRCGPRALDNAIVQLREWGLLRR